MRALPVILLALLSSWPALSQSSTAPSIASVVNASSNSPAIAPNTWVTIYGSGLSSPGDSRSWQTSDFIGGQMPAALDGVSVTMNGENAYVSYISPTQVNILTPPDLAAGLAQVEVTANGQTSVPFPIQAQTCSPAFAAFNGGSYVAAQHADWSIIGPATLYPGLSTPAQPGEEVVLYANGFGGTLSPVAKGSVLQSGNLPVFPDVQIGGVSAEVKFAGLISPGLYQFNVIVPLSTPSGDNTLTARYDGQSTQNGVLLTVQYIDMSLSNSIVAAGQSATLAWSSAGATACAASGSWSGSQLVSGAQVVTPANPGYYTYTLSCTISGQTQSQSVVLTAYGTTPSEYDGPNKPVYQASLYVGPPNSVTRLQTTLTVPPLPPVPSTRGAVLFLWPGLDPATNSTNFLPINNGVLQPVLTYGYSCAPAAQPTPEFSSWWISGQYVNTYGNDPAHKGCYSGDSMLVNPGDVLMIDIALDSSTGIWKQTVTDSNTNRSVSFSIDMDGQGQNWIYFAIEVWYDAWINTPVVFSNTTLTFQSSDTAGWCGPNWGKSNAYILTPPAPQNSGMQCFIGSIVLTQ
jgi:uncharacterized protein (TIGR03437 family)